MERENSNVSKDQITDEKRNKDLKIIYDEGKRIINNMITKRKKWLNGIGLIFIVFSVIAFILFNYFNDPEIRSTYLIFSILYLSMGLIILCIGYINPISHLEAMDRGLNAPKLYVKEWHEFFNNVDYKNLDREKYGLAEIILRIYYNIDQWLRIEYRVDLMKYQFGFALFFLIFSITIPLDNSFFPFKEIGIICDVVGLILIFIHLYMYSRKKMDEEVSKWHNRINDLDSELWNLWRGYR